MSLRVLNVTRGIYLNQRMALIAIEVCSAAWVIEGRTIRDVTAEEAIALRNAQAARCERLAYVELPWLRYEPSAADTEGYRREQSLARSADRFALQGA